MEGNEQGRRHKNDEMIGAKSRINNFNLNNLSDSEREGMIRKSLASDDLTARSGKERNIKKGVGERQRRLCLWRRGSRRSDGTGKVTSGVTALFFFMLEPGPAGRYK